MSRSTARRASTASPCSRKRPVEVVRRGLPGDEDRRARALYRGGGAGADGRCAVGGLYLPNGNPIGTDKFAYKLAWMERLHAHARELLALRGAVGAGRRLQRHPRADATPHVRRPGPTTRSSCRRRARRSATLHQSRPDRRAARHRPTPPASTPSGTTRPAPGRRTTASASTTCCCRRRPPTGCKRSRIDKDMRGRDKASDHTPVRIDLLGLSRGREGASMNSSKLVRSQRQDGARHRILGGPRACDGAGPRGGGRGSVLNGRDEQKLAKAAKSFAECRA